MTSIILSGKKNDIANVIEWCQETFGNDKFKTSIYDFTANTWTFSFYNPNNATLCKLRWN